MFNPKDILYEDNHLIVVNKRCGDLVQPDRESDEALETEIKAMIKVRDHKAGDVFLGVVHRIDRPVSGAVLFAKTSKALTRLNEMIRTGQIHKRYWAITESTPNPEAGSLKHYIVRDGRTNRSRAYDKPKADGKLAQLNYQVLACSTRYTLVEVELLTGRHHQIRAQLSKVGCPIKGDLKYGAKRSNPDGGISLHSRSVEFVHPVRKEPLKVVAPTPAKDNLWQYFETI
ncbi:MAG: RluA family pseudouridine synthase [Alistipes sp.]|nr:RluA family pseudouridine synthase [Alistipes sp.]MBQ4532832.1 RluA family pseudouridine synthase [Alistipes sp.]MBQ6988854.1 RluA family pseudouridine synthase [Alistipes sp.]